MSWAQAIEQINKVIDKMNSPSDGTEWLSRLEKTECKDAYRLGFCIAIDLAAEALTADEIAGVLDKIDNTESCPRQAFAKAFADKRLEETLVCKSRFDVPSAGTDDYIRVLTLKDFITHYKKNRSLGRDDVAAVRTDYFSEYVASDLSDIREWWSGANDVVWVMSRTEFESLKASGLSGDALATLLNDALGLGKEPRQRDNDGRELVAVSYPAGFDNVKQPTTLDAYWANFGWYYVSYGKEHGWGQTVSCSGTCTPLRERVHVGFHGLSRDFIGFQIGDILNLSTDRAVLVENANQRLESILSHAN